MPAKTFCRAELIKLQSCSATEASTIVSKFLSTVRPDTLSFLFRQLSSLNFTVCCCLQNASLTADVAANLKAVVEALNAVAARPFDLQLADAAGCKSQGAKKARKRQAEGASPEPAERQKLYKQVPPGSLVGLLQQSGGLLTASQLLGFALPYRAFAAGASHYMCCRRGGQNSYCSE